MKYDVFISYSRKDFDEVSSLIEAVRTEIPDLSVWFDVTGIESGDEFEDKIISAIDKSSYVLFALSENSLDSQWTKDEVMYARNTGKKVIPILLKGAQLKGWFLFKFGRIDCIDSTDEVQMKKLMRDLSRWVGLPLRNAGEEPRRLSESQESKDAEVKDTELADDVYPAEDIHDDNPKKVSSKFRKYGMVAGVLSIILIVLCVLGRIDNSEKRKATADQLQYLALISSADSLSKVESSLSEAVALYASAADYENQYEETRFSDLFDRDAHYSKDSLKSELRDYILVVNGIEYPMVYVEGGSFEMGSDDIDADTNEERAHRVTLSSYRIGKYEVTQELWEAVMGNNPSYFKGARMPVEQVSWDDCQEFIRKLNSLTGQNFRLPTEAQWEFAARGGNSSNGYKYSGSNYIDNVAWYDDNSGYKTHDVGTKSPNELGIYDMSGNVYEWCSDWKGSYGSSSVYDPVGPSSGSYRVNRGGSWIFDARYCRVSTRDYNTPDLRNGSLGLRLCL